MYGTRDIQMLIQIELRDTTPQAKRLAGGRIVMPACRVIKQAGDGIRLSNLAVPLQKFYYCLTASLLQKDPENPDIASLDKGTFPVVTANLDRFLCHSKSEVANDTVS